MSLVVQSANIRQEVISFFVRHTAVSSAGELRSDDTWSVEIRVNTKC